jgi:hypothetical protein
MNTSTPKAATANANPAAAGIAAAKADDAARDALKAAGKPLPASLTGKGKAPAKKAPAGKAAAPGKAQAAGKKAPAKKAPADKAAAGNGKAQAAGKKAPAKKAPARKGKAPGKAQAAGKKAPAKKAPADKAAAGNGKAQAPAKGKRAAIIAQANAGKLPPAPDWSRKTHYRAQHAALIELVKAGDVRALIKLELPTTITQLSRYRDLAVIALKARAGKAA